MSCASPNVSSGDRDRLRDRMPLSSYHAHIAILLQSQLGRDLPEAGYTSHTLRTQLLCCSVQ